MTSEEKIDLLMWALRNRITPYIWPCGKSVRVDDPSGERGDGPNIYAAIICLQKKAEYRAELEELKKKQAAELIKLMTEQRESLEKIDTK